MGLNSHNPFTLSCPIQSCSLQGDYPHADQRKLFLRLCLKPHGEFQDKVYMKKISDTGQLRKRGIQLYDLESLSCESLKKKIK